MYASSVFVLNFHLYMNHLSQYHIYKKGALFFSPPQAKNLKNYFSVECFFLYRLRMANKHWWDFYRTQSGLHHTENKFNIFTSLLKESEQQTPYTCFFVSKMSNVP